MWFASQKNIQAWSCQFCGKWAAVLPQIRPLADIVHFKYAPTYLLTDVNWLIIRLPYIVSGDFVFSLLRATAATAVEHLSHRNSVSPFVCLSVRLSITRVDQSKTVQARITKPLPLATWKTLVLGSVKLLHKFEGGHPERRRWMRGGGKIYDF